MPSQRTYPGDEEFFVETIALQPIRIEDPARSIMESSEAADLLRISRPAMSQMMDRGTLQVIRRSGSSRRYVLRDQVVALAALKGTPIDVSPASTGQP